MRWSHSPEIQRTNRQDALRALHFGGPPSRQDFSLAFQNCITVIVMQPRCLVLAPQLLRGLRLCPGLCAACKLSEARACSTI